MMTNKSPALANFAPPILITTVVALALRIVWIAFIDVNPVSDSFAYNVFAINIVKYGVFGLRPDQPGAYWAVGTPAIYAGAYLIFGINSFAVIFVNMISTVLTLWFIYALGRLYFDDKTGRLAALIFAFWPVTIQFTTVIASELHFMAATTAALYFWEKSKFGTRAFWANIVLSGLCFSAATFIRPIAQLIPIVLLIVALLRVERPFWHHVVKMGLVIIVIMAAVSPWSARNERVFGTSVSISTNFGANFWMGNHPGTSGGYTPLPEWTQEMGEVERSEALKELAFEYIKNEPGEFIKRTFLKAFKLNNRETIGVAWNSEEIQKLIGTTGENLLKVISSAYWLAAIALVFLSLISLSRKGHARKAFLTPPFLIIGYFVAVHAAIVVEDRYHMPQIPFMALLAAAFLANFSLKR